MSTINSTRKPPASSLLADTWLLLTLRLQLAWNGFRSRKLAAKILSTIGVLWIAVFAIGVSGSLGILAGVVLSHYPEQHLDSIMPGVILTGAMLLILLGSFGVALGSLFFSSDLDLLMSAPVDRRAVFASKMLDGLGFYYAALAATALPALIAYGVGLGYGPLYYFFVVVTLVGTPLLPAGLASILVLLVARFAPARRVREVLGLAGALVGISCGLLGQTSRLWMRQLVGPGTSTDALLASVKAIGNLPFPTLVAGRGLSAAGSGDLVGAVVGLAGFLVITFGFFAACVLLADNLYAAGYVRMQSSGSAKRGRQRAEQAASRGGLLSRATADVAIMLKDWRVIPRDLRNFAQMLSPLLFLPIVYLNLLGGRNSQSITSYLGRNGVNPEGVLIAGGVLFATALVFGRIAGTSISREGKAWWIIKAAPISSIEVIRGKFLAAYVPYFLLSSVLMIGAEIWKGFSIPGFLYGWYGVELLGAALVAIETGLSVPWARLDWDDPRRMSSGWGAILTLVAWAIVGLLAGGALCLPILLSFGGPSVEAGATFAGLLLATAISLAGGLGALWFGASRMQSVGEA